VITTAGGLLPAAGGYMKITRSADHGSVEISVDKIAAFA
jgi:hypothetical protein